MYVFSCRLLSPISSLLSPHLPSLLGDTTAHYAYRLHLCHYQQTYLERAYRTSLRRRIFIYSCTSFFEHAVHHTLLPSKYTSTSMVFPSPAPKRHHVTHIPLTYILLHPALKSGFPSLSQSLHLHSSDLHPFRLWYSPASSPKIHQHSHPLPHSTPSHPTSQANPTYQPSTPSTAPPCPVLSFQHAYPLPPPAAISPAP